MFICLFDFCLFYCLNLVFWCWLIWLSAAFCDLAVGLFAVGCLVGILRCCLLVCFVFPVLCVYFCCSLCWVYSGCCLLYLCFVLDLI